MFGVGSHLGRLPTCAWCEETRGLSPTTCRVLLLSPELLLMLALSAIYAAACGGTGTFLTYLLVERHIGCPPTCPMCGETRRLSPHMTSCVGRHADCPPHVLCMGRHVGCPPHVLCVGRHVGCPPTCLWLGEAPPTGSFEAVGRFAFFVFFVFSHHGAENL